MKVLIACEESQRVCTAFRERGHEAYSCDIIEPSGRHPEWHIKGDVLKILNPRQISKSFYGIVFKTMDGEAHKIKGSWDLLIAHPPCTYISNAGVRHLYKGGTHTLNEERLRKGIEASYFFLRFLWANCDKIAVENPIPSSVFCLPKYTQIIQPFMFGHPYTKRTCLWLKNLPPLEATNVVEPVATWCPSGSYSKKHGEKHRGMFTTDRARNHAKTFKGIAEAMAEQWGTMYEITH